MLKPRIGRVMASAMTRGITTEVVTTNRNALLDVLPPVPPSVLKPPIARVMACAMSRGITTEVVTTNRNALLDVVDLGSK
ncbi:MAG: hypothetical protein ACRC8Y_08115 [Chroococcales cyanobacterium]